MSNYEQIVGSSRPVFVRMENEGCPYAKKSQDNWKEASDLFPNIKFVRAECIYNGEVCSKIGGQVSPSHALFEANSTKYVYDFGNPPDISSSSSYFANIIHQYLGFYPFDTALIEDLIPQSANKFFNSYKYPIFILYDSNCDEDSDFVAEWIINAVDNTIPSEEYGFGKIDCSKYPDECLKWGSNYPSANVFSREKAISVSISELDNIADRIQNAISFLDRTSQKYPVPPPYYEPLSTPVPSISNVQIITVDQLQNREINDIRSKYNTAKTRTCTGEDYTGTPEVFQCNDVEIKPEVYTDSIRLINFFRELAGVPSTVTNDVTLNEGCYIASKYSSRAATLSHTPNEYFKNHCNFNENWELIKKRLANSNLAQGENTVLAMIAGLMDDEGANNEGVVGHRRWFLYPYLKTVGIGFYPLSKHKMDGYSIQYPPSGTISVNNDVYNSNEYTDVNFISWPSAGPFPFERIPTSWSVYYKEFQKEGVTVDNIIVKLTRDDGQILECSRIDLSKNRMGMPGFLVFKLTEKSLKLITAGHSVHVQIYLLKDSVRDCLDYTIDFFDDNQDEYVCFYNTNKDKCPSNIADSNKFGNGQYSNYKSSGNARTIIHVVEDIKLTSEMNFDFSKSIIVKGNKIEGKIIIGIGNDVDIHDSSALDVVIQVDSTNLKCGILRTPGKTKSITMKFQNNPTSKQRIRSLFYVGSYTDITFPKKITFGDYNYYFSIIYNDLETYLISTPISFVQYACYGYKSLYDIDSSIVCYEFSESSGLRDLKTSKKMLRIYADGTDFVISANNLPDNQMDVELLIGISVFTIEYSSALERKAKTLKIKSLKGQNINPKISYKILNYYQIPFINSISSYDETFKIYPFKNLYLSNLNAKINLEGYSIPYLLGDEDAKKIVQKSDTENEIYEESQNNFVNNEGFYEYPSHNQDGQITYPLFITNGGHDEYTISRKSQYSTNYFRFRPTKESASKPITIIFSPQTDINEKIEQIFIEDYQDVTIKTEKVTLMGYQCTYFSRLNLVNVSKARFIDTAGNTVEEISTDITGIADLDLSSDSEKPVNFNTLNFRTHSSIEGKNSKIKNANIIESSPTLKNFQIQNLNVYDSSSVKLVDCTVTGQVELHFHDKETPLINLKNCQFNPSSIKVVLWPQSSLSNSGLKLLSTIEDLSLVIADIDPQFAEGLKDKVTFYQMSEYDPFDGTKESKISDYKAILSKDKKGIYLVTNNFDEANDAPAEIPTKYDSSKINDNFELNPSPPPAQTPQATYPPEEEPVEINSEEYTISSNNNNDNNDDDGNNENENPSVKDKDANKKKGLSGGQIAGIVIGVLIGCAAILAGITFLIVWNHKKKLTVENEHSLSNDEKEDKNDEKEGKENDAP